MCNNEEGPDPQGFGTLVGNGDCFFLPHLSLEVDTNGLVISFKILEEEWTVEQTIGFYETLLRLVVLQCINFLCVTCIVQL
jgi:hypothetical protein